MNTPTLPDRSGHFGEFGGKFVIEALMPALQELEKPQQDSLPNTTSTWFCADEENYGWKL